MRAWLLPAFLLKCMGLMATAQNTKPLAFARGFAVCSREINFPIGFSFLLGNEFPNYWKTIFRRSVPLAW
jgi:hypothetical protein